MDEASEMIRKNKKIADKFTQIEAELPLSSEPAALFENLLLRLQKEFAIPFVWVSIIERPDLDELIRSLAASPVVSGCLNLIDEASLLALLENGASPVLANRDLQPYYRLFPSHKKYFIKSIAMAPLMIGDRPVGSINYGDADGMRYEPGMDTTLLRQLTSSVSSRLEALLKRNAGSMTFIEEIQ